jgi:NAD(P)-dependent dehydrogenase (short-subunit alcohol dehydrogenase family)
VVITARSHVRGQQAAEGLRRAGGEAHFIPGDLADLATPEALVCETVTPCGRLDFAYNNASIDGRFAPLADLDIAVFEHVININLRAVFLCMKYEIQHTTWKVMSQISDTLKNSCFEIKGLRKQH